MTKSAKSNLTTLLSQLRKQSGIQPIPLNQQEAKLPLAALGAAFSKPTTKPPTEEKEKSTTSPGPLERALSAYRKH
ncbi:hypothetical protein [Magnetococcus marinus]|uniref:hypothetical protein n=1 Tax=Magnetococcus marinus TaxID=1124597 RepID=UPI0005A21ADB|nr:hypothetical protein [Magnetococcus marinus]